MKRTSERAMALEIVKLLRRAPDKRLSIREIVHLIPRWVSLTKGDQEQSPSRPGEPRWHQIVRNIRSHGTGGEYGLRIIVDGFSLNAKPPAKVAATLREIARERREARL